MCKRIFTDLRKCLQELLTFRECLLCTRDHAKCFIYIVLFNLLNSLCHSHFIDQETGLVRVNNLPEGQTPYQVGRTEAKGLADMPLCNLEYKTRSHTNVHISTYVHMVLLIL